jgi:fatty-acid peroxygenase
VDGAVGDSLVAPSCRDLRRAGEVRPERFSPARHEQDRHPHAFVPNGAGDAHRGHKCAGYEFSPLLLQVFLAQLLRSGAKWTFAPGQDLSLDWRSIPPAPRDGLRVRLTR